MVRVRVNDEFCTCVLNLFICILVRLGNSGLKISRLVMGTMQYGSQDWQPWILGEKDAISHIKAAFVLSLSYRRYTKNTKYLLFSRYDLGIQTFDTADVCIHII